MRRIILILNAILFFSCYTEDDSNAPILKEIYSVSYYENGEKEEEFYTINDKKNGMYRNWYENGKIKSEGEYDDNVKLGVWKYYYNNNAIKETGEYSKNKIMEGNECDFYKSVRIGLWKKYYKNGRIKEEGIYNGQKYCVKDTIEVFDIELNEITYDVVLINVYKKDSIWKYYDSTGLELYKVNFDNESVLDTINNI